MRRAKHFPRVRRDWVRGSSNPAFLEIDSGTERRFHTRKDHNGYGIVSISRCDYPRKITPHLTRQRIARGRAIHHDNTSAPAVRNNKGLGACTDNLGYRCHGPLAWWPRWTPGAPISG